MEWTDNGALTQQGFRTSKAATLIERLAEPRSAPVYWVCVYRRAYILALSDGSYHIAPVLFASLLASTVRQTMHARGCNSGVSPASHARLGETA
jgi:hypothetical protein